MSEQDPSVDELAKIIWDYHHMHQQLKKADCIFVLGSHDTRVAEYGADLFLQGYAPFIIFSGRQGVLTKDVFKKTEAEIFSDIAKKRGVSDDKILIEDRSTNTGENIQFTKELLSQRGLHVRSCIVVQKPYMERRTYATFKKVWSDPEIIIASPSLSYDEYFNDQYPKEYVINIMVGDLQRIIEYPAKGFQIPQDVPDDVIYAYEELVRRGYTKHLIS